MTLLVDRKGPGQTAQMRSLTRAFAVCAWPKGMFSPGVAQTNLCYTIALENQMVLMDFHITDFHGEIRKITMLNLVEKNHIS